MRETYDIIQRILTELPGVDVSIGSENYLHNTIHIRLFFADSKLNFCHRFTKYEIFHTTNSWEILIDHFIAEVKLALERKEQDRLLYQRGNSLEC